MIVYLLTNVLPIKTFEEHVERKALVVVTTI